MTFIFIYAWGAQSGDPPVHEKKFQCLKLIFRPFGTIWDKKGYTSESGNDYSVRLSSFSKIKHENGKG